MRVKFWRISIAIQFGLLQILNGTNTFLFNFNKLLGAQYYEKLIMLSITRNRFPICQKLQIDSLLTPLSESTYLNT